MKIILLALAISTNVYVIFGASTTNSYPRRDFETTLEEKCFENSHNKHAFEAFTVGIRNFRQCGIDALGNLEFHPVEHHEEFCTYLENSGFDECLENFAMDVLPCLDKTEIFFPQMILNAYNSSLNKFCGTNGLVNTEFIFNKLDKNQKCIQDAKAAMILEGRCIENLTAYKNFQQFIVDLNKHDYCIDMASFVSCATELVEEECDDDFTLLEDNVSELLLGVCQV